MSSSAFRLPTTVRPERYDLRLSPDLVTTRFTGSVSIAVTVAAEVHSVVVHALDLDITRAEVATGGGAPEAAEVTVQHDDETITLMLSRPLPVGSAVLSLDFEGVLDEKLRGLYRSTFTDDSGATHTLAVTQFEATDARRAFPCFDEPEFKATFAVTLDVAGDLLAVSNAPELGRDDLGDGRVRVRFADTMPMSTYLVALVVGPLEITGPVDVDGTPLRIVHPPGKGHLAGYALEVGAFCLRYFADYYGIVYPGAKVDLVAVPDFAFGAMENLGCVTFREALLLVDPATATHAERQAVVDVIAHELAHMWFGDLVTMKWWNGIWLNEAFATFMEMKCTDAFRPDWERWMHFGRERATAFDVDALASTRPVEYEVRTPTDADDMFDTLTYQKGSAVVRMLEQYLGETAFQNGIRRYLTAHQYGNTETTDLWDAIEAETGEPVRALMDSWIFQGGFPLVHVSRRGSTAVVTQQRFTTDGSEDPTLWHVPLRLRAGDEVRRAVITVDRVELPAGGSDPLVANAGGHGFYRVAPDQPTRAGILDHLERLEPLERFAFLDDTWALVTRGDLPAAAAAEVVQRLRDIGDEHLATWQLAAAVVDGLGRAVDPSDRDAVDAWTRGSIRPVLDQLGPRPAAGDDDLRREARGVLVGLLGLAGDIEATAVARDAFTRFLDDPAAVDAGLAAGALRVVAATATADDLDVMIDRFRHGATPQEQVRFLYAMGAVRDEGLFDRVLDLYAGGEVRSQNVAFAFRVALANPSCAPRAWRRVRSDWPHLIDVVPWVSLPRLLESVGTISDPALAADVEAFLAEHPVPAGARTVAQHLDRMRLTVALRAREAGRLPAALGS